MAKVIIDLNELSNSFEDCCKRFSYVSFLTAWAGDHEVVSCLDEYRTKIVRSVVGLHFYQTSPNFIKRFLDVENIHYIKKTASTDIFHPKIYLFYNNSKEWRAFVGSSNLTGGGFSRNIECNVTLSSDEESCDVFNSFMTMIETCWNLSENMDEEYLEEYESRYGECVFSHEELTKPVNPSMLGIDWNGYIDKLVQNEGCYNSINSDSIRTRIAVLKKAEDLFMTGKLVDFADEASLGIAGLSDECEGMVGWDFFGRTSRDKTFSRLFKNDKGYRRKIYRALENIPLHGEITRIMYENYMNAFVEATGKEHSITIFTRFLAMKRPDVFVCLTSKNEEILEFLGWEQRTVSMHKYWEKVRMRAVETLWYNASSREIKKDETDIFKYKMAMLDALCYKR